MSTTRVLRVLNNNAVMVSEDDDRMAIVLGRAIGYGKTPGDVIDAALVTERFLPDQSTPIDRLAAVLTDTPIEVVRVAREIAELAHTRLALRISQALILPLADHLAFALERVRTGTELDHPLRWEVGQLYPAEVALAKEALELLRRHLGADLPIDEATPIAMHLVNAQFAVPSMAPTIDMTARLGRILDVIEAGLGIRVDRNSMSMARFVTHLRYLFVRLRTRREFSDEIPRVTGAIAEAYPQEHACAERLRFLLTMDGDSLSGDEVAYLTLHIARLARASGA